MLDIRAMNLLITFDDKKITMDEIDRLDKDGAEWVVDSLVTDEGDDEGSAVVYEAVDLSLIPRGDLVDISKMTVKIADFGSGMLFFPSLSLSLIFVSMLCWPILRMPRKLAHTCTRNSIRPRLGYPSRPVELGDYGKAFSLIWAYCRQWS
jgi:hypothetical protein